MTLSTPYDLFYRPSDKSNTQVRIARNKWKQRGGTIALGCGCRTRKGVKLGNSSCRNHATGTHIIDPSFQFLIFSAS